MAWKRAHGFAAKLKGFAKFWKKGNSEALGFIAVTPVALAVFVLTVDVSRLVSLRQKMEYTTYVACRAAAVSDDYDSASRNGQTVAENELRSYSAVYGAGEPNFEIVRLVGQEEAGIPNPIDSGYDSRTGETRGSWKKGDFIQCVLTVELHGATPLLKGEKKCEMTMAVEKEDY